jgi:DNA repair exonuclease SbcCD ATPase subunit
VIPQRIQLQGFLCYREKKEIRLGDASLWMLSGLNGSGKSAVFDAVTYALFGGHRGGVRNAEELINKETDGLVVELDFRLGEETFRVKRTLKRAGRSTRQVLRREDGEAGKETWQAVENTGSQKGFEEWVAEHVGLNYDTFTSSVLLLQGKAEKLLNADSKDRREVLAGIVDLERYERLHRRADERRKKFKDRSETLQQKLDVLPEVADAELAEADERIAAAQAVLVRARAEVERCQLLKVQGEHWAELRARLEEAKKKWERARGLLERAEAIERDWARLRLLRSVLPSLRTTLEQRQKLRESLRSATGLTAERDKLAAHLNELDYAQEQARKKREALEQETARDRQRQQDIAGRLVELSGVLERVSLCEKQRAAVLRLEKGLAELPADPTAILAREQEAHDRLNEVVQALPFLTRLREEREGLRLAKARTAEAAREVETVGAHGAKLAEELKALKAKLEEAGQGRQRAEAAASEGKARLTDAANQVAELDKLHGAKVCRHCGQPLTPEHLELERATRERVRTGAQGTWEKADREAKAAVRDEKKLQKQHQEKDEEIRAARDQFRDCANRKKQADQDVERHTRECARVYRELAVPFRVRVAEAPPDDWLTTSYPGEGDLAEAKVRAAGLTETKRRLQTAQAALSRWHQLQGQCEAARKALAAQEAELPPDVPGLRQEHAALKEEDAALKKQLEDQRSLLKSEQDVRDQLEGEREKLRQQTAESTRKLSVETARQEGFQDALARARAALPDDWRSAADELTAERLRELQGEHDRLEKQGAESGATELEEARSRIEFFRQEKGVREQELEEVPAEARREPAELARLLAAAKQDQAKREDELGEVRNARKALTDRRAQREHLHAEFLETDRQYNRYRLLAELLGPKRLQLRLVREAERGIVDYANEVLDRLSGGQLYLRLRADDGEESAERALDLESFNRSAGEAPLGVAFLSGSQRFRIAVSLALGIGQYASRQHRPIESVIIDEGFGCLDRQGRQVMIQELQNLRDQMRCILLVSHQEEFADAFANGYRFELVNGTTEVTPFQR